MRSNYWKLARVIGNALVIFSSEEYFRLGSTLRSKFQLCAKEKCRMMNLNSLVSKNTKKSCVFSIMNTPKIVCNCTYLKTKIPT